ncbi:MAG TPA: TIGR01777 family oxidoreductase [Fimbriiglobus sp.]
MTILVSGATGLVGSRLVAALLARGDRVIAVSRRPGIGNDRLVHVVADPTRSGPWLESVRQADAVVHLAGAGVFDCRWSTTYKRVIRDSRVESTAVLARALAEHPLRPDGQAKTFLSGSAIGYYGSVECECDESAPPGDDFLARVCIDWESAAAPANAAGVRVVHPRISVVLDPAGGALPKLLRPFKLFLGGPIASGRQWVSWCHRDDMTAILLHLLDSPEVTGPVNAASPEAVRNAEFCRTIGKVLHRPSWFPVPRFALRLVLGEAANAIAGGQNVVPRKLRDSGFGWRFPDLEAAIQNLLGEPGA